jgi:hypothetical protein
VALIYGAWQSLIQEGLSNQKKFGREWKYFHFETLQEKAIFPQ